MQNKLKNVIALSVLPQIVLVKYLGSRPTWVETYYSTGFYSWYSTILREILGPIPFSVGDILYVLGIFLILYFVVKRFGDIRKRPLTFIRNMLAIASVLYFFFHISWGMNYYRLPIEHNLKCGRNYSAKQLETFTKKLVLHTNGLHQKTTDSNSEKAKTILTQNQMFAQIVKDANRLAGTYPFLCYKQASTKLSSISTILSYMGYAGYLNPFTNESQVNSLLPTFRFPIVSAHEIGHQLGYAAESEANMIGYLITSNSKNPYFRYQASAYALSYCLSELNSTNPELAQQLYGQLDSGILKDFKEMREFWGSFENPFEPIFKNIYSNFLKVNAQTEGIRSYNAVVGLLINYHEKHPFENVK